MKIFAAALLLGACAFGQEPEKPAVAVPVNPDPLPDWRVRRDTMFRHLVGLQGFIETVPGVAFDTGRNFPHEWGRKWSGVGKRFASHYGQFAAGETIEFGISALRKEDPRYFRLGGGPIGRRIWHSVKSTWIARDADGEGNKLALGRISGVYGSWAIAQTWSPESVRGPSQLVIWGTFRMGTKTGVNALREFWPDIKRRFSKPGK